MKWQDKQPIEKTSERWQNAPMAKDYTYEPFGPALAALLRVRQHNPVRANLYAFWRELDAPFSYQALRLAVVGDVQIRNDVMEAVAEKLGIQPEYFREYRMNKIIEAVESSPDMAGELFEWVQKRLEEQ